MTFILVPLWAVLDWEPGGLGTHLGSSTDLLYDLGQVTYPLGLNVLLRLIMGAEGPYACIHGLNLEIFFCPECPELGISEKFHGSMSHILINFREETHGVVKSVCTCVYPCPKH